jgi:hypothetical protein
MRDRDHQRHSMKVTRDLLSCSVKQRMVVETHDSIGLLAVDEIIRDTELADKM